MNFQKMWIILMIVVVSAQESMSGMPIREKQKMVGSLHMPTLSQEEEPKKPIETRRFSLKQPLFSRYEPRRYLDLLNRVSSQSSGNVRKPVTEPYWMPDFTIDEKDMREKLKSKIQDFRYDENEAEKRLSPFVNRRDRPSQQNVVVVYNSSGVGISQGVGSAVGIHNSSKSGVGIGGASIINQPSTESQNKRSIVVVVNSNGVAVAQGVGSAIGVSDSPETGIGIGGSSVINTKKIKKPEDWQKVDTAPIIYFNGQMISSSDKPPIGKAYSSSQTNLPTQTHKISQPQISTNN